MRLEVIEWLDQRKKDWTIFHLMLTLIRTTLKLCVSDVTFMDDLTSAKMASDGGESLNKLTESALQADVLVWDDLGKSKHSESKEGLYYKIINERYLHKKPIIFSSNEDTGTLADKIGYAASSRLLGMCGDHLYKVEGKDYRLRKGA
nr:ATP-binding protein [Virgibacillus sp. AGTR]